MIHSTERLDLEWHKLMYRPEGSLIVPVVLALNNYLVEQNGMDAVITDIFRTFDEQLAICRKIGVQPYRSVHEYWRGVDVSVRHRTPEEVGDAVAYINGLFRYGGRFQVAAFHRTGTAPHIHLQVPPETPAQAWVQSAWRKD